MSPTKTENWPVQTVGGAPEPGLLRDIQALVAAAAEFDGNPPLSEQTLVELRSSDVDPDSLLILASYAPEEKSDPSTAEDLAGVAVVVHPGSGTTPGKAEPAETGVLEIVVHPNYRNQGVGALLADKLKTVRGLDGIRAWSHGNHEAAADLAARYGFHAVRELWRMRLIRPLESEPVAAGPEFPAGVSLRAFIPGQDEASWLEANAAAFAHHPEQGGTTLSDLQARMSEPWFDPAGFLLATETGPDGRERILGFHWTKVHPRTGSHPAIGEVYVVGVTPQAQGRGLGKALTIAGIRHLQAQGLNAIMLYVDADNSAAVALYHKLGFTRWDVDVMYASGTP